MITQERIEVEQLKFIQPQCIGKDYAILSVYPDRIVCNEIITITAVENGRFTFTNHVHKHLEFLTKVLNYEIGYEEHNSDEYCESSLHFYYSGVVPISEIIKVVGEEEYFVRKLASDYVGITEIFESSVPDKHFRSYCK